MGFFQQLFLVLGKNFTLLARQPITFSAVIIWPLTVAVLLAVLRQGLPPVSKPECSYPPRSVPSSGILPFVQSTVCTISNKCENGPEGASAQQARARMSSLMTDMEPLVNNTNNLEVLKDLPESVKIVRQMNDVLLDENITAVIGADYRIEKFIKDPEAVRTYLVNVSRVLDDDSVTSLFNASINFMRILELTGGQINFKEIVCRDLTKYLIFTNTNSSHEVSRQLCLIHEDEIPRMVETLQKQIDIRAILELGANITSAMEEYGISAALRDSALLMDFILDATTTGRLGELYPVLVRFSNLIRQAGPLVQVLHDEIMSTNFNLSVVGDVLSGFDPLVRAVVADDRAWIDFKNALYDWQKVVEMLFGVVDRLPNTELTLGDMLENPMTVGEILARYMDPDIVQLAMGTPVNTMELEGWIGNELMNGSTVGDLLCNPELIGHLSNGVNQSVIQQFQSEFCRLDLQLIEQEMKSKLGLDYKKLIELVSMRQRSMSRLNYTELVHTVDRAIQTLTNVPDVLTKVLAPVSAVLPDVLQSVVRVFAGISTNDTSSLDGSLEQAFNQLYNNLAPYNKDGTVDAGMWATMGMVDITLQAVYDALNEFGRLASHQAMIKVVRVIFTLPYLEAERVLLGFVNPGFLQMISEKPDDFNRICNPIQLSQGLGVPDIDLAPVSQVICNGLDFANLIMSSFKILDIGLVTQEIDAHLRKPVPRDRQVLQKMFVDTVNKLLGLEAVQALAGHEWRMTMKQFQLSNPEFLEFISGSMAQGVSTARFLHVVKEMAPRIETKYPVVRSYALGAHVLLEKIHYQMDTGYLRFSPFLELIQYAKFTPDIIESTLNALMNPALSSKLIDLFMSWEKVCDKQTNLRQYMILQPNVPIETIRDITCTLNLTDVAARFVSAGDWTHEIRLIDQYMKSPTLPPVQWDTMIDLVTTVSRYVTAPDQIQSLPVALIGEMSRLAVVLENVYGQLVLPTEGGQVNDGTNAAIQGIGQAYAQIISGLQTSHVISYQEVVVLNLTDYFMTQITDQMRKLKDEGLRLDNVFVGDMDEIHAMINVAPDVVKMLTDNIYTSSQLSTKIAKFATCPILECHWLRELLPDADRGDIDILEHMIATGGNKTLQELMQEPIVQTVMTRVQTLHPDVPDTVVYDGTLHVQHAVSFGQVFTATVQMTTPIFRDAPPGFDMEKLNQALNRLTMQNQTWDKLLVQQSFLGLEEGLLALKQQKDPYVELLLRSVTGIIQFFNLETMNSKVFFNTVTEVLNSEELTKLAELVKDDPDVMSALSESVLYWVSRPSEVLAQLMKSVDAQRCYDDAEFARIFRPDGNPALTPALKKLQETVCSKIDLLKMAGELETSFGWVHDLWKLTQDLSVEYKEFNPKEIVEAIKNMTVVPMMPDLFRYVWEPFEQELSLTIKAIMPNTIRFAAIQLSGGLTGYLATDNQTASLINPVLHSLNTIMAGSVETMKQAKSLGYNMTQLYANYPQLLKIAEAAENSALLVEVLIRTSWTKQSELQTSLSTLPGLLNLCQSPADVLDIPQEREAEFTRILQNLCSLNVTQLNVESMAANNVDITEEMLQTGPVNMTEFVDNVINFVTLSQEVVQDSNLTRMLMLQYEEIGDVMRRLGPYYTQFIMNQSRVTEAYAGVLDMALVDVMRTNPELSGSVHLQVEIINAMTEYFEQFIGESVSLQTLTKDQPEMGKLVRVLETYPDLLVITTMSLVSKMEKWLTILPTLTPATFCTGSGLELMMKFDGYSDPEQIVGDLCKVDVEKLVAEVMQYPGYNYTELLTSAMDRRDPATLSSLVLAQMHLQDTLTQLGMTANFTDLERSLGRLVMQDGFQQLVANFSSVEQALGLLEPIMTVFLPQLTANGTLDILALDMIVRERLISMVRELDTKNLTFYQLIDTLMPEDKYPSLHSMIALTSHVLPIFELAAITSQTKPVEWGLLMSNVTVLCDPTSSAVALLDLTPVQTETLQQFLQIVCKLNDEQIMREALEFIGQAEYQQFMMSGKPLNESRYAQVMLDSIKLMLELQGPSPPHLIVRTDNVMVASLQAWQQLFQRIAASTQTYNSAENIVNQIGTALSGLLAVPFVRDYVGYLHAFNYIIDQINGRTQYLNRSAANAAQMFPDAPELQKLMEMLPVAPQVAEVLLTSYETLKFASLIDPPNVTVALGKICHPLSNISDYLTTPVNSSIDLNALKSQFCLLNISTLMEEIDTVFDIKLIEQRIADRSLTVNTTQILMKTMYSVTSLSDLFNNEKTNWTAVQTWMDPKPWLELLTRYSQANSQTSDALKQAGAIFVAMVPLFENDTTAQTAGRILYTAMEGLINNRIMTDSNFSLEKLLTEVPQMNSLYQLVSNLSVTAQREFLHTVLNNPARLLTVVMATDPNQALCSLSENQEVKRVLCAFNATLLAAELDQYLGVQNLIGQIMTSSRETGKFDWMKLLQKTTEVVTTVMNKDFSSLIKVPTGFDPRVLNELSSVFLSAGANVTSNGAASFGPLLQFVVDTLNNTLLNQQLYTQELIYEMYSTVMSRLGIQDGKVDLRGLLMNSNEARKLMDAVMTQNPSLIDSLLSMVVRFDQLPSMMVQVIQNPQFASTLVCNPAEVSKYFVVDTEFAQHLKTIFCDTNDTIIVAELMNELGIAEIVQAMQAPTTTVNATALLAAYEKYQRLVMSAANVSDVTYGRYLLQSYLNVTIDEGMTLVRWIEQLPKAEAATIGRMMDKLMPVLMGGTPFWTELKPYLVTLNMVAAMLDDKMAAVPVPNITLASFLTNATKFRQFLAESINASPELIELLMSNPINNTKLMYLNPNDPVTDFFCHGGLLTTPGNETDRLLKVVCRDLKDFVKELESEFSVREIVGKMSLISSQTPFNWTETVIHLSNVYMSSSKLVAFIIDEAPDVFQFLGSDRDAAALMMQINKVLTGNQILIGSSDSTKQILDIIATSMRAFDSIPELQTPLRLVMESTQVALNVFNRKLEALNNQPITFESLLVNATKTRALLESFTKLDPHVIDYVIKSALNVTEVTRLLKVGQGQSPARTLCQADWNIVFIPYTNPVQDANKLRPWFCQLDSSIPGVDVELMQQLDVMKFVQMFTPPIGALTNDTFDEMWQAAVDEVMTSITLLGKLDQLNVRFDSDLMSLFDLRTWMDVFVNNTQRQALDDPAGLGVDLERTMYLLLNEALQGVPEWQMVLDNMEIQTTILNYVTGLLTKLTDDQRTLTLRKLFPDEEKMERMLLSMVEPNMALEFMMLTVQPAQYFNLMNHSDYEKVMCDDAEFDSYFTLPPRQMNKTYVQTTMCEAMRRGKGGVMKEMMEMMDVNSLMKEIGVKNNRDVITRYFSFYKGFSEGVPIQTDSTEMAAVQSMVTRLLPQMGQEAMGMCEASYAFYMDNEPLLLAVQGVVDVTMEMMKQMPEYVTFLEKMPNMTMKELLTFVDERKIPEMMEKFQQTMKRKYDCAAMATNLGVTLPQMIPQMAPYMDRAYKALGRMKFEGMEIMNYLQKTGELSQEAMQIMNDPRFKKLMQDMNMPEMAMTLLQSIQTNWAAASPVYVKLSDIMMNVTSFTEFLQQSNVIVPGLVDNILTASFGIDLTAISNLTREEISTLACDQAALAQKISLPAGSPITMEMLSQQLCALEKAGQLQQLLESVDLAKLFLELSSKTSESPLDWISGLAEDFTSLVEDGSSLVRLVNLTSNINLNNLVNMLPELQRFVREENPEQFIDSLIKFINDLRHLSPRDPNLNKLIDDMDMIARGIKSMEYFQRIFPFNVVMRDLVKRPDDLLDYLMDHANMTESAAIQLLNSSFSFVKLMNMSHPDIEKEICDPAKLEKLVTFSDDQVDVSAISRQLCELSPTKIGDVLDTIIQSLDVGDFIKNVVTLGIDDILKGRNISIAKVKNTVEKLQPLEEIFTKSMDTIRDIGNRMKFGNESTGTEAQVNPLTETEALGQAVCGDKAAFKFSDTFSVGSAFSGDGEIKGEDKYSESVKEELEKIQGASCQDLFKSIQDMSGGSIMWSFLKPLMMGRVVYAPSTPETDAIMREANGIFDDMKNLISMMESLVSTSNEVANLGDGFVARFTEALENPMFASAFGAGGGMSKESLLSSMEMVSVLGSSDVQRLVKYSEQALNYSQCMEKQRFEGAVDEETMVMNARRLADDKRLIAGVVFTNIPTSSGNRRRKRAVNAPLPKHVEYKIRVDVDNTPNVETLVVGQWNSGPQDGFANDMRYLRGFLPLQDMIDRAIISAQIGETFKGPAVKTAQFPYPCHSDDNFLKYSNAYILPITMMICWMVFVSLGVKSLVSDREQGIDETLRIMGLRNSVRVLAWFISMFIPMVIVSILFVVVLNIGGLLPYSNPIIIFIYIIIFSVSVLMLSYMVSAFFTSTNLAALVAIVIYLVGYIPYTFILAKMLQESMTFWQQLLAMIPTCSAFSFAATYVTKFEAAGVGIQWSNMDEVVYKQQGSFMWCCIMMLIDSVGYFLIGWYFRNVLPGKFGIPQPWYFPVSPRYWGCTFCYRSKGSGKSEANVFTNASFDWNGTKGSSSFAHEANLEGRHAGVRLRHLTKRYRRKTVVDNLTADFFEDDITSFLGRNGAGKTTTIDMLTGLSPPSSGTAYVNGYDVSKDWLSVRRNIGICPQYNLLYDTMTVEEHLRFFAGLKSGMPKKVLDMDVENMLANIGLWHMRREKVKALSGGMKRRLAVSLAFIGGSSTIILDEPTSGVDPSARRKIWDLIIKYKEGRTIILTTHHLDEADILSDRIVIINKGQIISSGSPMFLKRQFGRGYELTMSMNEADSADAVLQFVQRHVTNASITKQQHNEVRINLPSNQDQGQFQNLFDDLDKNLDLLKVQTYGLSDTTIDEVITSMCEMADTGRDISEENLNLLHENQSKERNLKREDIEKKSSEEVRNSRTQDLVSGAALVFRQFGALFTKRFHHHKRYLRGIVTQILLPCLLVALAAWASTTMPGWGKQPRPLVLSPGIYSTHHEHVFFKNDHSPYNTLLTEALLGPPGLGTMCMREDLKPYMIDSLDCVDDRNVSFTTPAYTPSPNPGTCRCEANRQVCEPDAAGAPPPRATINPGARIYDLNDRNISDYLLHTHSQFIDNRFGGWQFESDVTDDGSLNTTATVWYNNRGPHSLPAFYNGLSNAMLRAAVSNKNNNNNSNPDEYGITVYNDPLHLTKGQISAETILSRAGHMGIAMLLMCAIFFIPAGFVVFLVLENRHQEKRLQFVYGIRPLVYWLTHMVWDMLMFVIPVGLIVLILWLFNLEILDDSLDLAAVAVLLLLYGWAVLPVCYLFSRHFPDSGMAFMWVFITQLFVGCISIIISFLLALFYYTSPTIAQVYTVVRYVFMTLPPYTLGDALVGLMRNQVLAQLFASYGEDVYVNPFTFSLVGWHMVALGAVGVVALFLTIVSEERCSCCTNSRSRRSASGSELLESDILNEQYRVTSGETSQDVVVLDGLRKVYKSGSRTIVGVDEVYAGVQKGECFGLLGENGAGKTSLFGMLTGEITPTSGKAVICGSTVHGTSTAFRTCVGYCPQFDALDYHLTGREMLYFYAKLKGVTSDKLVEVVDRAVLDLELTAEADQVCGQYSGGTRRRLAVAIALLADPQVVLLDEPTSGMDVQMRRLIWSTLSDVMNSGRSVIVTSHRMDECEAACSRMAIMVNGNLKCLGTPQHLKSKYGTGYTVSLHLTSPEDVARAVQTMRNSFPDCLVKDHRHRLVELNVPVSEHVLSRLFGLLESQRHVLGLIDYSIKQTTLDQVFLGFCRNQTDGVVDVDSPSTSASGASTPPKTQGYSNAAYFPDHELQIQNGKRDTSVKKPIETVTIEIPQINFPSSGEPTPESSPVVSPRAGSPRSPRSPGSPRHSGETSQHGTSEMTMVENETDHVTSDSEEQDLVTAF